MRSTHTLATLEVSAAAYDEIATKLRTAGWNHAFVDATIDMNGVGLERRDDAGPTTDAIEAICDAMRARGIATGNADTVHQALETLMEAMDARVRLGAANYRRSPDV